MSDLFAIVLPSGIGVRFVDLTPKQGDELLETAARELPADGTVGDLMRIEAKMGYEAMVKEVTKGRCKSSEVKNEKGEVTGVLVDLNHPDNVWVKYDPDSTTPFSNKDHSALKSLYIDRNKVAPGEVAAILGKAVRVAT